MHDCRNHLQQISGKMAVRAYESELEEVIRKMYPLKEGLVNRIQAIRGKAWRSDWSIG